MANAGAMKIECPKNMLVHVQKVLDGEYDIAYWHPAPVILDIGANIGSFAAWAFKRWPAAQVHCYEPLPDNFALLKRNLAQFPEASVRLNNFAIGDPSPDAGLPRPQQLRRGKLLHEQRAVGGDSRGLDEGA